MTGTSQKVVVGFWAVVLATGIAFMLFSCMGQREPELQVVLNELPSPESIPMFPLAAFSPDGYLALTYEKTVTHQPYSGYGGFQIYLPSADGFSFVLGPRLDLPGQDWASDPYANIGGFTLFWEGDTLFLGPDIEGLLPWTLSIESLSRYRTTREAVLNFDDKEVTLFQFGIPECLLLCGSMMSRGTEVYAYDMVQDCVGLISAGELAAISAPLDLTLMLPMSVFHTDGSSREYARRNLWLLGSTLTGRLVGVSRADGEVFLFHRGTSSYEERGTLWFERLGSASRSEPVWQPGFADDTLVVASDAFDRRRNIVGVRLERWTFRPDAAPVKTGTVIKDLKHATLLPFGVALRDSHHGVLFGVGRNGILQAFVVKD